MIVVTVFLIVALLCFFLAMVEWPIPSNKLIAAGLFLWLLATLIQTGMK